MRIAPDRALLFWALASFAANLGLARFSYGVLLPALRHDFAASYGALGAINALNLGGYLAGTLAAPLFARGSTAQTRSYLGATIAVAFALAASAVSGNLAELAFWRIIAGFGSAIAIAMTAVATFERVLPAHRASATSAMWAGAAIGIFVTAAGAPLTAGSHAASWRFVWLAMALATLVAAVGFAATLRVVPLEASVAASHGAQRDGFRMRDMLRPHRFLFLSSSYLLFGMAYIAYATFAVALFRAHGIPATGAGLAWALVGVGGVAGAYGIGYVLDSPLRHSALPLAGLMGAFGGLLAAGPSLLSIVTSALLFGFGCVATPAVITALSRERSTAAAYAGTYTAVTTMLCVGQFAGPLLAGPLVDRYGLSAAALFTMVVYGFCTLAAVLDARGVRKGDRVPYLNYDDARADGSR